jgi:hypothetical protein
MGQLGLQEFVILLVALLVAKLFIMHVAYQILVLGVGIRVSVGVLPFPLPGEPYADQVGHHGLSELYVDRPRAAGLGCGRDQVVHDG